MDLWQQMQQTAQRARAKGALLTIDNEIEIIEQDGIPFLLRTAPQLVAKIKAAQKPQQANPFLPPEDLLTVGPVGAEHLLILNKFNVLPLHGLLITHQFVEQTDQLSLSDFCAVSTLLDQVDGLIFYNGGRIAGASQPHRHFQLVPRDLGAGQLPVERAVQETLQHQRAHLFPFCHRLSPLADWQPETLLDSWQKLEFAWQPYNLLLTRDWMLVVPRSQESWQQISVNSLGFAGALLAKDKTEYAVIREMGPLSLLRQVTKPSM